MAPGRGGAGNYEAAAAAQPLRSSQPVRGFPMSSAPIAPFANVDAQKNVDLEANYIPTAIAAPDAEAPEHIGGEMKSSGQDVIRTGRGHAPRERLLLRSSADVP